jgi:hypothetical protein
MPHPTETRKMITDFRRPHEHFGLSTSTNYVKLSTTGQSAAGTYSLKIPNLSADATIATVGGGEANTGNTEFSGTVTFSGQAIPQQLDVVVATSIGLTLTKTAHAGRWVLLTCGGSATSRHFKFTLPYTSAAGEGGTINVLSRYASTGTSNGISFVPQGSNNIFYLDDRVATSVGIITGKTSASMTGRFNMITDGNATSAGTWYAWSATSAGTKGLMTTL